jgi:hypothetical protein
MKCTLSSLRTFTFAAAVLAATAPVVKGQYLGFNAIGDYGLKSGTQPVPGLYILMPTFYRASYDGLRNATGDSVLSNANVSMSFLITGAQVTTDLKILGGTYGFQVLPMFADNRITAARPGFEKGTGMGWSDIYFQPINLGWSSSRADFMAAYGVWAPSGTAGRTLHFWGHQLASGTTLYLDKEKKWHLSGTAFFDINQTRQDQDIKVGNYLTVEGGAGRSFLKGAGKMGVAYAMQWKVSDDSGSAIPPFSGGNKNRVYGIGPSITMPVFAKGTTVGLVNAAFLPEFGARTNFEGHIFLVGFTLAKLKRL